MDSATILEMNGVWLRRCYHGDMAEPPCKPTLMLSHILAAAGLDPAQTLLIRHSMAQRQRIEQLGLLSYTGEQGKSFHQRQPHWLVFLGEGGTTSRFAMCYDNIGEPHD